MSKFREHANDIILWAKNVDAEAWFFHDDKRGWESIAFPSWYPEETYKVILPQYKEAWLAYLDGELQYLTPGSLEWKDYVSSEVPKFTNPDSYYRRKPKEANQEEVEKDSRVFINKEKICRKVESGLPLTLKEQREVVEKAFNVVIPKKKRVLCVNCNGEEGKTCGECKDGDGYIWIDVTHR